MLWSYFGSTGLSWDFQGAQKILHQSWDGFQSNVGAQFKNVGKFEPWANTRNYSSACIAY